MQPLSRHDEVYQACDEPSEEIEPTCGYRKLERYSCVDLAAASPIVGIRMKIIHKIENRAAR